MSNRKELLDNEAEQIVAGFGYTWNGKMGKLRESTSNEYIYVFFDEQVITDATMLKIQGKSDLEIFDLLHSQGKIKTMKEFEDSVS